MARSFDTRANKSTLHERVHNRQLSVLICHRGLSAHRLRRERMQRESSRGNGQVSILALADGLEEGHHHGREAEAAVAGRDGDGRDVPAAEAG